MALRKYHLRGEWFIATDDAAKVALDCFPDVVAAVIGGPVKVSSLNTQEYDRVRKRYEAVFGRKPLRTTLAS
jgi:hypothetical protein